MVEDEYYLAAETASALRQAGAQIIGPCPKEEDALALLQTERPHAAVLDVNLGAGACYVLAEALEKDHVPFVFVTGYDRDMSPAQFENIQWLGKPVDTSRLVAAVARIITTRRQ